MANCINSDIFKRASTIVKHFCTRKGEKFSEALVIYMMKLLSIHPKYDAAEKDDEILVQSLSEDCVKMHIEKDNPAVLLVGMKVYFDLNYRRSEQFHKENRKNCKRKCNPVLQKILVAAPNFLCHEVVLRDIITFLLLYASDKINAVNLTAMKNIVLTVLPISEIPTFLAFSQKERKDYMMELAPVAAGIKVNTIWSTEQGQRAINKVITKLVDTVSKLFLMSQTEFSKVQALIKHLQGVLKYYLLTEDPKIEEPFSFDLTYLKSLLAFLNMYSFFYCILMEDCQALAVRSFQLEQAFRQALDDLVATLSTEVIIPSTVFSYYKEVGTLWKFIKDEMLYFKSMVTVFKQLSSFKNNAERNLNKKKIMQLLEKVGEKVDLDMKPSDKNQVKAMELLHRNKLVETGGLHSSGKKDNIQILSSDSIKNTDEVSLEFEGFCPWALVHGQGSLLPANRKLGLVMYQSRCYGFCSADGRNAFLENPDSLLNAVWDFVREQGYFIIIFKLQDSFDINMQVEDMPDRYFVPPILISSTGCQTDLHPVEKRIDEGYTWNQWWWRKRALKYVDIKTKGTHSTQTDLSHFRRENYSQVYLPKENWSQTRKDGSTTMPKAGIPELKHPVRKGIL